MHQFQQTLDEAGPQKRVEVPVSIDNVVLDLSPNLKLDISFAEWKKAGWRIEIALEGFGSSFYNKEPYSDRETAEQEYKRLIKKIENKEYVLNIHAYNTMELK